ncbi:Hypothetical predicted protein [Olea europaea subsp. europaea]|uniref:Uncharacterized protein n=1 Tax=Olea europaea subsp. europaea TaxID=158383 RepID=A0A8S0VLJ4_OLEEU|nr:Hypothetical predicted protein [Olea europaea subsp. europaea]
MLCEFGQGARWATHGTAGTSTGTTAGPQELPVSAPTPRRCPQIALALALELNFKLQTSNWLSRFLPRFRSLFALAPPPAPPARPLRGLARTTDLLGPAYLVCSIVVASLGRARSLPRSAIRPRSAYCRSAREPNDFVGRAPAGDRVEMMRVRESERARERESERARERESEPFIAINSAGGWAWLQPSADGCPPGADGEHSSESKCSPPAPAWLPWAAANSPRRTAAGLSPAAAAGLLIAAADQRLRMQPKKAALGWIAAGGGRRLPGLKTAARVRPGAAMQPFVHSTSNQPKLMVHRPGQSGARVSVSRHSRSLANTH